MSNCLTVIFGAKYDPIWDGKSVLLHLSTIGPEHMFLGDCMFASDTLGNGIKGFTSKMGNNGRPFALEYREKN